MDIDLLSKMVKGLILDRDRVTLPGVGTFVAEMTPASFSDRGYTINPPYRRLYFRPKMEEDNSLVELYASANNVGLEVAEKIVSDFLGEMKDVLKSKKVIVFPGLGRLRATRENNFFFVADEDLDIYPEGFGLEAISLKTHQETRAEVAAAVEELREIIAPEITRTQLSEPESEACDAVVEEEKSDIKMETDDTVSGAESTLESETEQDADPDTEQDAAPEPDVVPESETQTRTDTDPDTEPDAAPESGVVPESETQTRTDADTEPDAAPEPDESAPESEIHQDTDTDHKPDSAVSKHESEMAENEQGKTERESEMPEQKSEMIEQKTEMPEQKSGRRKRILLLWVAGIAALFVLLLVTYIILSKLCPEFIDSILYNTEQLEVLKYWK